MEVSQRCRRAKQQPQATNFVQQNDSKVIMND